MKRFLSLFLSLPLSPPPLLQVKFYEMLKLNLPDWPLILLGITMSAIVGCLFPVQSILFSEMLEVRHPHTLIHHRYFRLQIMYTHSVFHQVFGESSREEIEQGVSGLALGFVGLAVGAGIAHFTAVSHYFCYYIYLVSHYFCYYNYLESHYFCYYNYLVWQPYCLQLISSLSPWARPGQD